MVLKAADDFEAVGEELPETTIDAQGLKCGIWIPKAQPFSYDGSAKPAF